MAENLPTITCPHCGSKEFDWTYNANTSESNLPVCYSCAMAFDVPPGLYTMPYEKETAEALKPGIVKIDVRDDLQCRIAAKARLRELMTRNLERYLFLQTPLFNFGTTPDDLPTPDAIVEAPRNG